VSARLDWLLDFVAPRRCLGCDAIGGDPWCVTCGPPSPCATTDSLDGIPVFALGGYTGALANAIRRFKYEPSAALAAPLAHELARLLAASSLPGDSVLVPVPLHPKRLAERGFNQSALLARALGRRLRLAVAPLALERTRETGQQAELGHKDRLANVAGAFSAAEGPPRRVALVDDVVTTGATVMTCVQALAQLDVDVVAILALARTPGRIRVS
jgi:ComF family protein